jgi:hypothetical protein
MRAVYCGVEFKSNEAKRVIALLKGKNYNAGSFCGMH